MNTAARLICTTWQNGQNGDLDVVRPIHLSQVSNAAPTVFVGIDLEPIGIAVVPETAVDQIPLVLRFFSTRRKPLRLKSDDSFSQLSRAGVCSNRVTRRPGLVPTLSERAGTKPILKQRY